MLPCVCCWVAVVLCLIERSGKVGRVSSISGEELILFTVCLSSREPNSSLSQSLWFNRKRVNQREKNLQRLDFTVLCLIVVIHEMLHLYDGMFKHD